VLCTQDPGLAHHAEASELTLEHPVAASAGSVVRQVDPQRQSL
jgi:hypothetical protein